VEDSFQATFLILARKASAVRKAVSLASWLHGVASRTAWKARTGFARRRKHESRAPAEGAVQAADDLTWREVRQVLHEELSGLAERYRAPLVLCYLEGKTQAEACVQLGLPKGTLKGRLERGRALLRTRLVRRGLGPAAVLVVSGWPAAATADVSSSLVIPTVRAATRGAGPARVVALADGMIQGMIAGKLKLAFLAFLAVGLLGVAGVFLAHAVLACGQPNEATRNTVWPPETARPRVDRHGDALPDGALNRLGTLRFRHGYELRAAVFGPGDAVLFSAGSSRVIRVWDASTGKELAQLKGHTAKVNSLALAPGGKLLASAIDDRTVILWDAHTRKEVRRLKGHQGVVARVAFSPGGRMLASAGADESVRLWDVSTGQEQRRLPLPGATANSISSLAFAPDGKTLGCGCLGNNKVSAHVVLWQVETGKELRKLDGYRTHAFLADGRLLTVSAEHLRLWDHPTSQKWLDIPARGMKQDPVILLSKGWSMEPVVVVSPDGKTIAALTREDSDDVWAAQVVRVWDVKTAKLRFAASQTQYGIRALAFSKDGKTLAIAPTHGVIRLWDARTGEPRDGEPGSTNAAPTGHHGSVRRVAFLPDGQRVLSGGDDYTCRLWDLTSGAELRRFAHNDMVIDFALSPDGRTLVVGCGSTANTPLESLFIWDLTSGRLRKRVRIETDKPAPFFRYSAVHAVAFAPDGKTFAIAGFDEKVRIWNASTLEELKQFPVGQNIFHLAFTPGGKGLAGSGGNGMVVIWDPATGREQRRYPHADKGMVSFALSPDGRLLATANGKEMRLWELVTGRERLRLPAKMAFVAFSANSRWIASYGHAGRVKVWDAATGREALELAGHTGWVDGAAFSPLGTRLATGSWDSTVLVWELASRLRCQQVNLPAEGRDKLWKDLGDADPARAQRVMSLLTEAASGGVAFLAERLKPARPDPGLAKRFAKRIEELDSDDFEVRQRASKVLQEMGEAADPFLRAALKGGLSLETRRRVETLLAALEKGPPSAGRLRELRAVEMLERIDNPDARQVLDSLATGYAAAGLTQEAKAALRRLAKVRGAAR
jgi:RNA polymerase sigma factor (sigma-70 family)